MVLPALGTGIVGDGGGVDQLLKWLHRAVGNQVVSDYQHIGSSYAINTSKSTITIVGNLNRSAGKGACQGVG